MQKDGRVTIGVAADLASIFDTILESQGLSADITLNESGSRIYTFPAGVEHATVLKALEEAYAQREADKQ